MKAICNGRFILPQEIREGQALVFDERIRGFCSPDRIPPEAERIDVQGAYVSPGFLNLHIHGCGGRDAMDGSREALETMSRLLPATGVTGWLPTTMKPLFPRLFPPSGRPGAGFPGQRSWGPTWKAPSSAKNTRAPRKPATSGKPAGSW